MLRIEKLIDKTTAVLRVSGRIEEDCLAQLQAEIKRCDGVPKLDLADVTLLDRSTVRFLVRCESEGIQLMNCSLYIQEWMAMERRRRSVCGESE